ncbi:nuclear transport factor 2 family protein [Massilia aurea]|uniref:nuclear transport factor 2 family protein n=1 Tax=Massilia aurea TaxID=373040 RepID=UPI002163C529|nr:nuclear transport factor 2 family protein [Massilia aurea]MCS0709350.1 nuclear transport factor 2 family protein [Massilia aurea]
MTIPMPIPIPTPVADYFLHANARDADAGAACFSQDAEVRDEGHVYRGRDAIHAWKRTTSARYGAIAHPVSCEMTPPGCIVQAEVTGNFPGSPARIVFDFSLDGPAITALAIRA